MRIPVRCHAIPDAWFLTATSLSGFSVRWFKDEFSGMEAIAEQVVGESIYRLLDRQAESVPPGSRGLIFLPYLLGERTPLLDPKARGAFIGISSLSKRIDFYRAVLEGVGYALKHNLEACLEMGVTIRKLAFCGGGSKSALWRSIVADILGVNCEVLLNPAQASCIGLGALISVAMGVYADVKEAVKKFVKVESVETFSPELHEKYHKFYSLYKRAYSSLAEIMHKLSDLQASPKEGR
jgi:xylulokinase